MSAANGHPSRPWANGVSVPLATPFRADESVDHAALAAQVTRLAKAGVGIVLLGTNGEGESIEPAPGHRSPSIPNTEATKSVSTDRIPQSQSQLHLSRVCPLTAT
jgi:dihydrodipicolinate synthase/N-acetylneuraminate lyase